MPAAWPTENRNRLLGRKSSFTHGLHGHATEVPSVGFMPKRCGTQTREDPQTRPRASSGPALLLLPRPRSDTSFSALRSGDVPTGGRGAVSWVPVVGPALGAGTLLLAHKGASPVLEQQRPSEGQRAGPAPALGGATRWGDPKCEAVHKLKADNGQGPRGAWPLGWPR